MSAVSEVFVTIGATGCFLSFLKHHDCSLILASLFLGACEGTLACSTCHVIISKVDYDRIENKPCDEELDMLDLAYDLTDT